MNNIFKLILIAALAIISGVTCQIALATPSDMTVNALTAQSGKASWYGPGFHGRTTANGERYNMHAMTAAHKTLPFGTMVRVINKRNGKSVTLRINDRGPYKAGRIIDLSKAANAKLDCHLCAVTVEVISFGDGKYKHSATKKKTSVKGKKPAKKTVKYRSKR